MRLYQTHIIPTNLKIEVNGTFRSQSVRIVPTGKDVSMTFQE